MFKRRMAVLVILCFVLNPWLYRFDKYPVGKQGRIVEPEQVYTYEVMESDIKKLAAAYPGLVAYKIIGTTPGGRDIWAVHLGKGKPSVLINASHHANEWLTTNITMYMIDRYAWAYKNNLSLGSYNVRDILDKVSIWFVPMVNPDGVTLQQSGAGVFPVEIQKRVIALNNGSRNFKRWKANIEGVDLNLQYPADWDHIATSVFKPNYKNHKGTSPLSAREAVAMVDFTYAVKPEITVSYHSSGRVIFWNFHNREENLERDLDIAQNVSNITGYALVRPEANPSGGGYKDWFIQEFNRPAFTIEIGKFAGSTNLDIYDFTGEWESNKEVGLYIAKEGYEVSRQK